MGDWYVIANILTFAERKAVNPIKNYRLNDDGTIATTFTFNKKHNEGPAKTLTMTGFANNRPDNGVWRMQWIWPIKADYRIAYLDTNYQLAIIGRNKRDYVWLMSRKPNPMTQDLDWNIYLTQVGGTRDKDTFAALFENFSLRLRSLLLKEANLSAAGAEGLSQEIMIKVWFPATNSLRH